MDNLKEKFMKEALKEAKKAYTKGEVPIGVVIVKDDVIISRGHNLRESKNDALAHAELIAIKKACKKLGAWRLADCDMYVTMEPCAMCSGALINARIRKVYIGAKEPKFGAAGSKIDLLNETLFNHTVEVEFGILENECIKIIQDFFRDLRIKKKNEKIFNNYLTNC